MLFRSRQLWWGQQIPAWYAPDGSLQVAATRGDAYALFAAAAGGKAAFGAEDLTQDEDVLDTWFSSWLWPIEVFKGVTQPGNPDISYYYPTSVLVTGQDIIFFWVARMIMAGLYYFPDNLPIEKRVPFRDVYFTGMVRDKQGRKMSKQLGNSPDLLELIDKYGADAVRFGIMISSPAGNDLLFDEGALEQGRNFNNKLWNALKLVQLWEDRVKPGVEAVSENFAVQWFENRLADVRIELEKLLADFKLSEALKTLYSLIWDDFCSWYLEWVKPGFEQPIDAGVYAKTVAFYEELLQLLHPFMPFITEEIYHLIQERTDDLCVKQFAAPRAFDGALLEQGTLLKEVITAIRDARNKAQIKPKESINLHIQSESTKTYEIISSILIRQVNAPNILFTHDSMEGALTVVVGKDKFYISTADRVIDLSSQKEQIQKELVYLKGFLESVNKKLGNERFVQNAKPEVIDLERRKLADAEAKIKVMEDTLAGL